MISKTICIVQDGKETRRTAQLLLRYDVAVLKVMILLDVLLTRPSDSAAISLQSVTYHQDCRIVDTD